MNSDHWKMLRHGSIAGGMGYLAIVLYYGAFNLLRGRSPVDTVAALGQGLFGDTNQVPVIGAIIAYNGLHLVFFLALGIAVAWLLEEVELHPATWYVVLFALDGDEPFGARRLDPRRFTH